MDRPVGLTPQQVEIAQPAYAWVRPCGRVAELGFKDKTGALVVLALPHEALSMLLMTLPRLIETSLQQRTGDASMRHVYPADNWQVEAADGRSRAPADARDARRLLGVVPPAVRGRATAGCGALRGRAGRCDGRVAGPALRRAVSPARASVVTGRGLL